VYRKVRGTVRYLLGNLADFDPAQHTVPYDQLPTVDRLTLSKLHALMAECKEAYDSFQFYKVFQVQCAGSLALSRRFSRPQSCFERDSLESL